MANPVESFGKYVLLEKLATGGMAEVFLGRGSGAGGIGKFFAIKRILPQYADSPEFIEMFKDEAKIAINLNHSNIVSIHEFGVEKGQFFLVMDYVEGRNLRQILNKMKKVNLGFTIDQIVFIVKEVAAGLDHAHRCIEGTTGKPLNITHRDMSPQNVMISFEGETKIVDFGIAKAETQIENTRAGTLKGKFGYMSPEQAEGQPVDLRTDIFSLGIVLWELLANDRLFVASNEINTLRKIRDCQIPSLRKINPNIHSELERIVQKALARDRNLRYQTGAALHRDLNRFLNRQYPDFSAQDFAVFIKSVFADEILALRKRLVEYAKLKVVSSSDPASTSTGQSVKYDTLSEASTAILDANTNSLVQEEAAREGDDADGRTVSLNELPAPADESTGNFEISGARAPSAANILDVDALGNSKLFREHEQTRVRDVVETEVIRERAPARPARRPRQVEEFAAELASRQRAARPGRFATFFVFAAVSFGVYAYLVKYYPGTMRDVITATAPVAGPLYCALGALPCGAPDPHDVANATLKHAQTEIARAVEDDLQGLVVSSNPSGAEIFLNGRSTGLVTPSRVEVPPQGNFAIALRKRGYREYSMIDVTRGTLGHRFDADLTKLNVGYLDVEFFPPQDATLWINGKRIDTKANQALDIQVPSNVAVRVRADSRVTQTYDEQTITLGNDQKKRVQLNPRRLTRAPASH